MIDDHLWDKAGTLRVCGLVFVLVIAVGVLNPRMAQATRVNLLGVSVVREVFPAWKADSGMPGSVCLSADMPVCVAKKTSCESERECYLRGIRSLVRGDWPDAMMFLGRGQDNTLFTYFLGWAFWCGGEGDAAKQVWARNGELIAGRFRAYGDWFLRESRPVAALLWFELSYAVGPPSEKTMVLLGKAHQAIGDLEEAANWYNLAITTNPAYVDAYFHAAVAEYELDHLEAAEKHIVEAVRLEPDYWVYHQVYGNILKAMRKWSEAEEKYRMSLAANPFYGDAYGGLGMVLIEMGRMEEARDAMIQAALYSADPKRAAGYLAAYADVARQVGDLAEAISFYERAVQHDPHNPGFLGALVSLYSVRGECSKAAAVFDELRKVESALGQDISGVTPICVERR